VFVNHSQISCHIPITSNVCLKCGWLGNQQGCGRAGIKRLPRTLDSTIIMVHHHDGGAMFLQSTFPLFLNHMPQELELSENMLD
jgi:hypothetical protein